MKNSLINGYSFSFLQICMVSYYLHLQPVSLPISINDVNFARKKFFFGF